MKQSPQLLVPWEPRWRSFCTSLLTALVPVRRGKVREVKPGAELRGPLASLLLHFSVVFAWWSLAPWWTYQRIYPRSAAEEIREHEVIYYIQDRLPEIRDAGGAETGVSGRAGGREFHHPTQVLRITRGKRLVDRIVEAPKLQLPRTNRPVANLLALSGAAPAPPLAALDVRPGIRPLLHAEPVNAPPDAARLPAPVVRIQAPEIVAPPINVTPADMTLSAKLTLPTPAPVAPVAANPNVTANPEAQPHATGGKAAESASGSATAGVGSTGLIISAHPGSEAGIPNGAGTGSLAMSPRGDLQGGFGGSGGGAGIGNGPGPGSGRAGLGPGSAATGNGLGADPNARGGTSTSPGPGGAGHGPAAGAMAGVHISAGVINIPSFGSAGANGGTRQKMPQEPRRPPAVFIVASPRAGGGLASYGALGGARVYTIYVELPQGTVVLQFANTNSKQNDVELTPPEPLRTELPPDLKLSSLLVKCMLDRSGILRDMHIVRASSAELAERAVAAFAKWRFRPVLRDNEPIDVVAMLGSPD